MDIRVESMKRCELVSVSGQVDSANAPELQETLLDLIEHGKRNFVVNMREVDFISSAGLTALLAARVKLRRRIPPGDMVMSEVPTKLRETFDLVGFHYLFNFFDQDLDAVGSF
jgi:anti-anti-sigma factor